MRAVVCLAVFLAACGRSAPGASSDGGGGSVELPDAGPPQAHVLHVRINGTGEVRASTFSCRSECTQTIGGTVHLVALPDSGWKFDGWQGACAGSASCDVVLDADRD